MIKTIAANMCLALPLASGAAGAADHSAAPVAASKGALLKAIVLNMGGEGASVVNARYNRYFRQHSAAAGVSAIIEAGKFFINGYAIPATAHDFLRQTPAGYLVNQVPWLTYDAATKSWKGGYKAQGAAAQYEAAALAVATGIVAGLEVRLYDTDHDGYTDLVDVDFLEGLIVSRITTASDGSYRLDRGDIDVAKKTAGEGAVFDGKHFTGDSGEVIKASNFDPSLSKGDIALFWYGAGGWVVKRARQVEGVFVDGADHVSYTIGGAAYGDAMRFSRDNLFISNRPGEFANAHKYFGFNNNREGWAVSLWLAPTTDAATPGAPVGMTSGEHGHAFLVKAIAIARTRLAGVVASRDGSDVSATRNWVTPQAYKMLQAAIARANSVADANSAGPQADYQVYLLYLNLKGSAADIGARYAGFNYTGFDNEIRKGVAVY